MDETIFNKIFSAASGVWALVAMAAVALFRAWPSIMERINERRRDNAVEKAGDWSRLRDEVERLSLRIVALEKKIREYESDIERWRVRALYAEAEVIRYEAYHQGEGDAKQAAQNILSAERTKDKKDKGDGD